MYYYEVLVCQDYVAGNGVFTYKYDLDLQPQQFVKVPLRRKYVYGIIKQKVNKPDFDTKHIEQHFTDALTAKQHQLLGFMADYYATTAAQVLPLFAGSIYTAQKTNQNNAGQYAETPLSNQRQLIALPELTTQQSQAAELLRKHSKETVILHGDTGTGKTRLYLEQSRHAVARGKSVLLLCPEIALIPQLFAACQTTLNAPVLAFHSQLTTVQKRNALRLLKSNTPIVIVGTRSALFLPHPPLGLIVLDECHEPAYKQEEGVRFYTRTIASTLRTLHDAQLILGSATPLVADMHLAKQRKKPIVRLTQTAVTSDTTTELSVVDMKNKADFNHHAMLSNYALSTIELALQNKQQSLVYLNRRGTARIILCQQCGWQALCPACDVPLTYHHDSHNLRCHTCGFQQSAPMHCPECTSTDIIFKSAGTKALVDYLQKRFPHALVARFDTDNTKAESFHTRQQDVASGAIDILVGTQMLVKGHDLPKLAVVVIVAADLGLQMPDYSAEERTFQLICQSVGRVGRGHGNAKVIVQTFNPGNKVIQQALAKSYDDFYTTQITERTRYKFPPAVHVASFWCSKKTSDLALESAQKMLKVLLKNGENSQFSGPAIMYHSKKRGNVSAQIVVKNTQRSQLITLAKMLPHDWQYDLEPINLL